MVARSARAGSSTFVRTMAPSSSKTALAAYFLGQEARVTKGLRLALTAALLHVLSGLAIFLFGDCA